MENLKELEISEMKIISGGSEGAYQLGYVIGLSFKRLLNAFEIAVLFA